MIDTQEIELPLSHTPFGARVRETLENDTVKKYRRRVAVRFSEDFPCIHVTSLRDGTILKLENSFLNAHQGHNACGSNDLRAITDLTVRRVLKKLGIVKTSRAITTALNAAVLSRLDIAVGFRCEHSDEIRATLKAMGELIRTTQRGRVTTYLGESVYASKSGATVCIYDKGREIECKKLAAWEKKHFAWRDEIAAYAKDLIRVELRLNKEWLIEHKMTSLDAWNRKQVEQAVMGELAKLDLTRPVKYLDKDARKALSAAERRFVMATYSGMPISFGYRERAERKLRNDVVRKGVFLGYTPGLVVSSVAKILAPENMRAGYPVRLRKKGLVFAP